MATHGELTVGKLKRFLEAFEDNTKIVIGQKGTDEVLTTAMANTYCPPEEDHALWVIIDPREHWLYGEESNEKEKLIKTLIDFIRSTYGYSISECWDYTYCSYCGKKSPLPEKGGGEPIKHDKDCIIKLAEKLEKK